MREVEQCDLSVNRLQDYFGGRFFVIFFFKSYPSDKTGVGFCPVVREK